MDSVWWSAVQLGVGDHVHEMGRQHHPAEPQRGPERLGRRPQVDDMPGRHPLEGAHGLPVVAELPVVVVLDDQPSTRACPVGERTPPLRVQGHPGRVLVRGREDDGRRVAQPPYRSAPFIDLHRSHGSAVVPHHVPVEGQAGVLHGDHSGVQHAREEREPLHVPGGDDDPLGRRDHPARPPQVPRQRRPQLDPAAWVPVVVRQGGRGSRWPGAARAARPPPGTYRRRGCRAADRNGAHARVRSPPARPRPGRAAGRPACRTPAARSDTPRRSSWSYAALAVPREIPSSAASRRVAGNRVPGASRPSRTASRNARSSPARRPSAASGSRWRSTPTPAQNESTDKSP